MKKLIAYSSISHMGFVTLGFFLFSQLGIEGALAQMLSHGFVSAAMFLCVGVMYDRMHSRLIADYGGVVNTMPKFAAFMMLFAMANAGLAGHVGIRRRVPRDPRRGQGEFLDRLRRGDHADPRRRLHAVDVQARDLRRGRQRQRREADRHRPARILAARRPLRRPCWCMGVWPKPFIDVMHVSVADLLQIVARTQTIADARPTQLLGRAAGNRHPGGRVADPADRPVRARRPAARQLLAHAARAAARDVRDADDAAHRFDQGLPRPDRRRHAGRFPAHRVLRRRVADAVLFAQLPRRAQPVPRRRVRADAVRAARHAGDDHRRQLPDALSGPRADVAVAVRAGRVAARSPALVRGGDEVLRARRARVGHAALRAVDDLRRHRLARSRHGRARRSTAGRAAACC